jgi:TolB-like protein/Flp pilus assembly protein TadD
MGEPANSVDKDKSRLQAPAILAELEHVLSSHVLIASPSLSQFLRFVVTETLAGRADQIKAYTIALKAWGRGRSFDPQTDPIVRIQAGRLRRALKDYYAEEGAGNPMRIDIPKGTYVPTFQAQISSTGEAQKEKVELVDAPAGPSLAVLPFLDLSGDKAQVFFIDGFGEELSVSLARFQNLSVIAYFSCRRFRDTNKDMREIGKELGVKYLVTGAIHRSARRLRISAAISDTGSGAQLWAQQFDHECTTAGLFDVRDRVVEQIVSAIGSNYGVIPRGVARASRGKPASNLSVYEAVLRHSTFLMVGTPKAYYAARQALEHAVSVDPEYAPAWAALGGTFTNAFTMELDTIENPLDEAMVCVSRALRLDPLCQPAYANLAGIYFQHRNREGVIRACERILDLNPNEASMVGIAGFWLALVGKFDRGLAYLDKSIELNPYFPGWFHYPYFLGHYSQGEYELALMEAYQFNMPDFFWDPLLRAVALSQLGRTTEAKAAITELLRLKPDAAERVHHYLAAYVFFDELRAQMLDNLHKAGLNQ